MSLNKLFFYYPWLHMRFDTSRLFKVINFCTNRQPIYDSLLVISCELSYPAAFPRHSAVMEVEETQAWLEPLIEGTPFKFWRQIYYAKTEDISLLSSENRAIHFIAIHWRPRRTTWQKPNFAMQIATFGWKCNYMHYMWTIHSQTLCVVMVIKLKC